MDNKIKVIAKHTLMYENQLVSEGAELEYSSADAAMLYAAGAVDYANKKDIPKETQKDEAEKQGIIISEKKKLTDNPGGSITIKGKLK